MENSFPKSNHRHGFYCDVSNATLNEIYPRIIVKMNNVYFHSVCNLFILPLDIFHRFVGFLHFSVYRNFPSFSLIRSCIKNTFRLKQWMDARKKITIFFRPISYSGWFWLWGSHTRKTKQVAYCNTSLSMAQPGPNYWFPYPTSLW